MTRLRVLCLSLLLALALAVTAEAHGGGKQQLVGETVGSFRVYAWTSPEPWRVGQAHTTVAVTRLLETQAEMPATGLQVFVTYAHDGQSERVAAVEQSGAQAGFYEADGAVAAAGEWQVTVEVAGTEGGGKTGFHEVVQPGNEFNWWLIGGGVLVALLVVGYFGTRKTGIRPVRRGVSS